MFRKHYIVCSLFLMLILSGFAFGQSVVQLVPFNGTPQTELITQIVADTTANNGILPDRVYELVGGGLYICQSNFYVPGGNILRLRSSNNDKPKIYLYPTGTGS